MKQERPPPPGLGDDPTRPWSRSQKYEYINWRFISGAPLYGCRRSEVIPPYPRLAVVRQTLSIIPFVHRYILLCLLSFILLSLFLPSLVHPCLTQHCTPHHHSRPFNLRPFNLLEALTYIVLHATHHPLRPGQVPQQVSLGAPAA